MLSSNILPALVSLAIIPILIKVYGDNQFGMLMICWSIVGYFNLFDLGIGRAVTHIISKKISEGGSKYDIAELIRTTLTLALLLGIFGGFILWTTSNWLVHDILKIQGFSNEYLWIFLLLAITIPFVILSTVIRSIFEAQQLFKLTAIIRTILGVSIFLGPFVATYFGANLRNAVISLVAVRFVIFFIHYLILKNSSIMCEKTSVFNIAWVVEIFKFSSWVTLSNAIGPFLDYMDRFFILSILGAAAVTYYVVPFDILTRLTFISMSISTVLYPLFSKTNESSRYEILTALKNSLFIAPIIIYPFLILFSAFAQELLSIWVGNIFSAKSAIVVCFLSLGLLINSYAQIVYAYLQGVGRSDLTGKIHLFEVVPYLFFLTLSITHYGIIGASISWFLRGLIDLFLMMLLLIKINNAIFLEIKSSLWILILGVLTIIPIALVSAIEIRVSIFSICVILYGLYIFWLYKKFNLNQHVRQMIWPKSNEF
jgi:O-antigen/teichoic acid export membrane protein